MRSSSQIIMSIPFILVGAWIMSYGVKGLWNAGTSKGWPTVPGKVISSKVAAVGQKGGTVYSPDVRYSYTVDGTPHTSNHIRIGGVNTGNPSPARHVVDRYPVGREVTVYYSPKKPTFAVLEPGIHAATWPITLIGFLFFGVGVFAALHKKKPRRLVWKARPWEHTPRSAG